jgi:hypothetical protein
MDNDLSVGLELSPARRRSVAEYPQIRRRTRHHQERGAEEGMKEKSKEFVENGAEVHAKA